MVPEPGEAGRTDRGRYIDPGGLRQHRGWTSVVRVDRDGALCRVRRLGLDENREDQRYGAEHQQGNGHKAPPPVDFAPLRLSGLAQLAKVATGAVARWFWSRSPSRDPPMARHFPPIPKMLGPLCVPPHSYWVGIIQRGMWSVNSRAASSRAGIFRIIEIRSETGCQPENWSFRHTCSTSCSRLESYYWCSSCARSAACC